MLAALTRLRARTADDDSGSMLIELIVSLVIFAVIASGIAAMSLSLIKKTDDNRFRSDAAQVLSRDLDTVRAIGAAGLTADAQTVAIPSVVLGGVTYNISREVTPIPVGGGDCGAGVQASVSVTSIVSWNERGIDPGTGSNSGPIKKSITGTTVITPPAGTYGTGTTGTYGITLLDRDNLPQANVPVNFTTGASGTSGTQKTTNSKGCALMTGIANGTAENAWTGTATPFWVVPGYMYGTDSAYYGKSATISANTGSTSTWNVDQAASISLNVNTDAAHPVPANVPFSIYNQSFPTTALSFPTKWVAASGTQPMYSPGSGTLTAASFPYLYPSLTGYTPWLGDCADADPGVTTTPSYRGANVKTDPGSVNTGTVNVVKIDVTLSNLTVGKPITLKATKTAGTTTGCGDPSENYTLYPSSNQTVVNATATTQTVSFAMPYGAWTFVGTCNGKTKTVASVFTAAGVGANTQAIPMALA